MPTLNTREVVGRSTNTAKLQALEARMPRSPWLRGPSLGNEAKNAAALAVVHDVNNLLNNGLLACTAALRVLNVQHPALRHVRDMRDALQATGGMTRELLVVAAGGARDVDVDCCVLRALAAVQRSVPSRVTVVVDTQLGGVRAACSESDLQRIVVNMVLNANDAIARSGTIRVRTSRPSERSIGLSVSDTGCGMTDAICERVFEPGFSTKDSSGVGLASVKSLVASAGGIVDIESEVGVGTTVSLVLPAVVHSSVFSDARPSRS